MEDQVSVFNNLHPLLVEFLEKFELSFITMALVRNMTFTAAQYFYSSTMKGKPLDDKISEFHRYFGIQEIDEEDLEKIKSFEKLFELIF